MYDPTRYNPSGRFSGLSALYTTGRPSYPAEAIQLILKGYARNQSSVLVDIGCGTGISTRLIAAEGLTVVGVDPNEDMLDEALKADMPADWHIRYCSGSAESTGLDSDYCDVVLCAQAFHWFSPESALREFRRILKPGGKLALMWNERDETDPFTGKYGQLLRARADDTAIEVKRGEAGIELLRSPLFENANLACFSNSQVLNADTLMARAFSTSYAPKRDTADGGALAAELTQLLSELGQNGTATMRYTCSLYTAYKPGE